MNEAENMAQMTTRPMRIKRREGKIGEILVKSGCVTPDQLKDALDAQGENGKPLGEILIEKGHVTPQIIADALAKQTGLRRVDLDNYTVQDEALSLINEDVARKFMSVPINIENGSLVVAVADPTNLVILDDLAVMTGYHITPVVCTDEEIIHLIDNHWRMRQSVEQAMERASSDDDTAVEEISDQAPIVKFVSNMISQAVRDRASDIHVEPQEKGLRIRYRIDGVLHEVMTAPKKIQSGVVSRLKIMADLDIAERRVPQDGRCALVIDGKAIDLRVATAPTVYGENVVMRILDKSSVLIDINNLGFDPQALNVYRSAYSKPYGCILVTGPTGSGKTTTLYATLNILNKQEVKIITTEDPVEYRLAGVNQIQINAKAGLTFAKALRSILRLDPDIVLVGEIRDGETAKIAIEAALTGHLVLTTLHTNDAPSALTRLTEMGIEPFLAGSAVECILAQRLARRLCPVCREPYEPLPELLEEMDISHLAGNATFYRSTGCDSCNKTGYKGRLGIYEIMRVSEEIERLVVDKASTHKIREVAIEQGMRTLRDDGIGKVMSGQTTLEEVLRVTM